jgi:hypothetical protein
MIKQDCKPGSFTLAVVCRWEQRVGVEGRQGIGVEDEEMGTGGAFPLLVI